MSTIIGSGDLLYSYDIDKSILNEASECFAWDAPTPRGLSISPNWVKLNALIVARPCLQATCKNDNLIDINVLN